MRMSDDDMSQLDADVVSALNALLEDERASVEIEVALASGATEVAEREVFSTLGGACISSCGDLHEELEHAQAPVTRRINGIVLYILGTERYDERLHAFAQHQHDICERVRETLPQVSGALEETLRAMYEHHERGAAWCEQRAQQFTASRDMEFATPQRRPVNEGEAPREQFDTLPAGRVSEPPSAVDIPFEVADSADMGPPVARAAPTPRVPRAAMGESAPSSVPLPRPRRSPTRRMPGASYRRPAP